MVHLLCSCKGNWKSEDPGLAGSIEIKLCLGNSQTFERGGYINRKIQINWLPILKYFNIKIWCIFQRKSKQEKHELFLGSYSGFRVCFWWTSLYTGISLCSLIKIGQFTTYWTGWPCTLCGIIVSCQFHMSSRLMSYGMVWVDFHWYVATQSLIGDIP